MIFSIVQRHPTTERGPQITLPPLQFSILAVAAVKAVAAVTADKRLKISSAVSVSPLQSVGADDRASLDPALPRASYSFVLMALMSASTSAAGTGIE